MNFLEPDTDRVVRMSIDAFLEGRLRPDVAGDRVFETKNSRYRVRDGKLVAATSSQLVGSELVGWLLEVEEAGAAGVVMQRWAPGARAVLLVRRLGRHIVVTSATLMMEVDGVLAEGSDTRPLLPGKRSTPAMLAVTPPSAVVPVIPKAAAMPRGFEMEIPCEAAASDVPPSAPRAPINPSTPPPAGPPSTPGVPGKALATPRLPLDEPR